MLYFFPSISGAPLKDSSTHYETVTSVTSLTAMTSVTATSFTSSPTPPSLGYAKLKQYTTHSPDDKSDSSNIIFTPSVPSQTVQHSTAHTHTQSPKPLDDGSASVQHPRIQLSTTSTTQIPKDQASSHQASSKSSNTKPSFLRTHVPSSRMLSAIPPTQTL